MTRVSPITTAMDVDIAKYMKVRPPSLPRVFMSPMFATPSAIDVTTIGTTVMNSIRRNICPIGTINAANKPNATPRGTLRRVKRHNSGERKRCAIGLRKRFSAISSRVGIYLRIRSARKVLEREPLIGIPKPCERAMRAGMTSGNGGATKLAWAPMW